MTTPTSQPPPSGLPPASHTRPRTWAIIGIIAAIAAVLAITAVVLTRSGDGQTSAGQPAEPADSSPTPAEPELSPEEQAKADIEATFTGWLLGVDEAWRTGGDPIAAAAPYVAGGFEAMTTEGLRGYQASGYVITGGAVELQRFEVTELDLTADPPTALADHCFYSTNEYVLNDKPGSRDHIYRGTDRYEQRDGRWVIVESVESTSEGDVSTSGKTC